MIPFNLHRRIPLVRRPFYQRDLAIAERKRVAAERDELLAERDVLLAERDVLRARSAALESFVDRNPAALRKRCSTAL
jgi:hypothetical protein